MQGQISEWTPKIIQEYKSNFPTAQIVISTWIGEKIDKIPCEIIKTRLPSKTYPYHNNINYQIVGTQNGLKKMKSEVIMKCRTDQFIHNRNIFKTFFEDCKKNQIMTSVPQHHFDKREYIVNDYYQVAFKEILEEYWNSMPFFDGSESIMPEIYLTKNYIQKIKKDMSSWSVVREKYFCNKDQHLDFKMEWEKDMKSEQYSKHYREIE